MSSSVSAVGETVCVCMLWSFTGEFVVAFPQPLLLLSKALLIEAASFATSCFLSSQGTVQINPVTAVLGLVRNVQYVVFVYVCSNIIL